MSKACVSQKMKAGMTRKQAMKVCYSSRDQKKEQRSMSREDTRSARRSKKLGTQIDREGVVALSPEEKKEYKSIGRWEKSPAGKADKAKKRKRRPSMAKTAGPGPYGPGPKKGKSTYTGTGGLTKYRQTGPDGKRVGTRKAKRKAAKKRGY
jgi:hypothetical protein|tara:strand:+ start:190 stop:642 length:453 start_codon:yes stop_codon:yes gene_type:complete